MNKLDRYIFEGKGMFHISIVGVNGYGYTYSYETRQEARDSISRFLSAGTRVNLNSEN